MRWRLTVEVGVRQSISGAGARRTAAAAAVWFGGSLLVGI